MKKAVVLIGTIIIICGGLAACKTTQSHKAFRKGSVSTTEVASTPAVMEQMTTATVTTTSKATYTTAKSTASIMTTTSVATTVITVTSAAQQEQTTTATSAQTAVTTTQHQHTWSEWEEIKEATLTAEGEKIRFCYTCNQKQNATIEKLVPYFEKSLGIYESENISFLYQQIGDWVNYEYAAQTIIYTLKRDDTIEESIKAEFRKAFGFTPTAEVKFEWVGQYMLDGYDAPQEVYCYKLFDTTYPLLDNEINEVYHRVCADGSPWVGYCVYADVWVEDTQQPIYRELQQQMLDEFVEVTGKTMDELENDDSYFISNASEATMRTREGTLVDVVYFYCRGIDYTWGPQSKPEDMN